MRKFACSFILAYPGGLSILVNNAGLVNACGVRKLTQDGIEESFGVNHLAHFLLTSLLLSELVKEGAKDPAHPSRVVIISSGAHIWGSLNFEDLTHDRTPLEEFKSVSKYYCNSKLANNLFNLELAKRLRAQGVNVNCYALCPGFVVTKIWTENQKERPPHWAIKHVVGPVMNFVMMKDAKEGTQTTMYCSLAKYLIHHSGEMYKNCLFWDYSQRLKLKEKNASMLWEKSDEMITKLK